MDYLELIYPGKRIYLEGGHGHRTYGRRAVLVVRLGDFGQEEALTNLKQYDGPVSSGKEDCHFLDLQSLMTLMSIDLRHLQVSQLFCLTAREHIHDRVVWIIYKYLKCIEILHWDPHSNDPQGIEELDRKMYPEEVLELMNSGENMGITILNSIKARHPNVLQPIIKSLEDLSTAGITQRREVFLWMLKSNLTRLRSSIQYVTRKIRSHLQMSSENLVRMYHTADVLGCKLVVPDEFHDIYVNAFVQFKAEAYKVLLFNSSALIRKSQTIIPVGSYTQIEAEGDFPRTELRSEDLLAIFCQSRGLNPEVVKQSLTLAADQLSTVSDNVSWKEQRKKADIHLVEALFPEGRAAFKLIDRASGVMKRVKRDNIGLYIGELFRLCGHADVAKLSSRISQIYKAFERKTTGRSIIDTVDYTSAAMRMRLDNLTGIHVTDKEQLDSLIDNFSISTQSVNVAHNAMNLIKGRTAEMAFAIGLELRCLNEESKMTLNEILEVCVEDMWATRSSIQVLSGMYGDYKPDFFFELIRQKDADPDLPTIISFVVRQHIKRFQEDTFEPFHEVLETECSSSLIRLLTEKLKSVPRTKTRILVFLEVGWRYAAKPKRESDEAKWEQVLPYLTDALRDDTAVISHVEILEGNSALWDEMLEDKVAGNDVLIMKEIIHDCYKRLDEVPEFHALSTIPHEIDRSNFKVFETQRVKKPVVTTEMWEKLEEKESEWFDDVCNWFPEAAPFKAACLLKLRNDRERDEVNISTETARIIPQKLWDRSLIGPVNHFHTVRTNAYSVFKLVLNSIKFNMQQPRYECNTDCILQIPPMIHTKNEDTFLWRVRHRIPFLSHVLQKNLAAKKSHQEGRALKCIQELIMIEQLFLGSGFAILPKGNLYLTGNMHSQMKEQRNKSPKYGSKSDGSEKLRLLLSKHCVNAGSLFKHHRELMKGWEHFEDLCDKDIRALNVDELKMVMKPDTLRELVLAGKQGCLESFIHPYHWGKELCLEMSTSLKKMECLIMDGLSVLDLYSYKSEAERLHNVRLKSEEVYGEDTKRGLFYIPSANNMARVDRFISHFSQIEEEEFDDSNVIDESIINHIWRDHEDQFTGIGINLFKEVVSKLRHTKGWKYAILLKDISDCFSTFTSDANFANETKIMMRSLTNFNLMLLCNVNRKNNSEYNSTAVLISPVNTSWLLNRCRLEGEDIPVEEDMVEGNISNKFYLNARNLIQYQTLPYYMIMLTVDLLVSDSTLKYGVDTPEFANRLNEFIRIVAGPWMAVMASNNKPMSGMIQDLRYIGTTLLHGAFHALEMYEKWEVTSRSSFDYWVFYHFSLFLIRCASKHNMNSYNGTMDKKVRKHAATGIEIPIIFSTFTSSGYSMFLQQIHEYHFILREVPPGPHSIYKIFEKFLKDLLRQKKLGKVDPRLQLQRVGLLDFDNHDDFVRTVFGNKSKSVIFSTDFLRACSHLNRLNSQETIYKNSTIHGNKLVEETLAQLSKTSSTISEWSHKLNFQKVKDQIRMDTNFSRLSKTLKHHPSGKTAEEVFESMADVLDVREEGEKKILLDYISEKHITSMITLQKQVQVMRSHYLGEDEYRSLAHHFSTYVRSQGDKVMKKVRSELIIVEYGSEKAFTAVCQSPEGVSALQSPYVVNVSSKHILDLQSLINNTLRLGDSEGEDLVLPLTAAHTRKLVKYVEIHMKLLKKTLKGNPLIPESEAKRYKSLMDWFRSSGVYCAVLFALIVCYQASTLWVYYMNKPSVEMDSTLRKDMKRQRVCTSQFQLNFLRVILGHNLGRNPNLEEECEDPVEQLTGLEDREQLLTVLIPMLADSIFSGGDLERKIAIPTDVPKQATFTVNLVIEQSMEYVLNVLAYTANLTRNKMGSIKFYNSASTLERRGNQRDLYTNVLASKALSMGMRADTMLINFVMSQLYLHFTRPFYGLSFKVQPGKSSRELYIGTLDSKTRDALAERMAVKMLKHLKHDVAASPEKEKTFMAEIVRKQQEAAEIIHAYDEKKIVMCEGGETLYYVVPDIIGSFFDLDDLCRVGNPQSTLYSKRKQALMDELLEDLRQLMLKETDEERDILFEALESQSVELHAPVKLEDIRDHPGFDTEAAEKAIYESIFDEAETLEQMPYVYQRVQYTRELMRETFNLEDNEKIRLMYEIVKPFGTESDDLENLDEGIDPDWKDRLKEFLNDEGHLYYRVDFHSRTLDEKFAVCVKQSLDCSEFGPGTSEREFCPALSAYKDVYGDGWACMKLLMALKSTKRVEIHRTVIEGFAKLSPESKKNLPEWAKVTLEELEKNNASFSKLSDFGQGLSGFCASAESTVVEEVAYDWIEREILNILDVEIIRDHARTSDDSACYFIFIGKKSVYLNYEIFLTVVMKVTHLVTRFYIAMMMAANKKLSVKSTIDTVKIEFKSRHNVDKTELGVIIKDTSRQLTLQKAITIADERYNSLSDVQALIMHDGCSFTAISLFICAASRANFLFHIGVGGRNNVFNILRREALNSELELENVITRLEASHMVTKSTVMRIINEALKEDFLSRIKTPKALLEGEDEEEHLGIENLWQEDVTLAHPDPPFEHRALGEISSDLQNLITKLRQNIDEAEYDRFTNEIVLADLEKDIDRMEKVRAEMEKRGPETTWVDFQNQYLLENPATEIEVQLGEEFTLNTNNQDDIAYDVVSLWSELYKKDTLLDLMSEEEVEVLRKYLLFKDGEIPPDEDAYFLPFCLGGLPKPEAGHSLFTESSLMEIENVVARWGVWPRAVKQLVVMCYNVLDSEPEEGKQQGVQKDYRQYHGFFAGPQHRMPSSRMERLKMQQRKHFVDMTTPSVDSVDKYKLLQSFLPGHFYDVDLIKLARTLSSRGMMKAVLINSKIKAIRKSQQLYSGNFFIWVDPEKTNSIRLFLTYRQWVAKSMGMEMNVSKIREFQEEVLTLLSNVSPLQRLALDLSRSPITNVTGGVINPSSTVTLWTRDEKDKVKNDPCVLFVYMLNDPAALRMLDFRRVNDPWITSDLRVVTTRYPNLCKRLVSAWNLESNEDFASLMNRFKQSVNHLRGKMVIMRAATPGQGNATDILKDMLRFAMVSGLKFERDFPKTTISKYREQNLSLEVNQDFQKISLCVSMVNRVSGEDGKRRLFMKLIGLLKSATKGTLEEGLNYLAQVENELQMKCIALKAWLGDAGSREKVVRQFRQNFTILHSKDERLQTISINHFTHQVKIIYRVGTSMQEFLMGKIDEPPLKMLSTTRDKLVITKTLNSVGHQISGSLRSTLNQLSTELANILKDPQVKQRTRVKRNRKFQFLREWGRICEGSIATFRYNDHFELKEKSLPMFPVFHTEFPDKSFLRGDPEVESSHVFTLVNGKVQMKTIILMNTLSQRWMKDHLRHRHTQIAKILRTTMDREVASDARASLEEIKVQMETVDKKTFRHVFQRWDLRTRIQTQIINNLIAHLRDSPLLSEISFPLMPENLRDLQARSGSYLLETPSEISSDSGSGEECSEAREWKGRVSMLDRLNYFHHLGYTDEEAEQWLLREQSEETDPTSQRESVGLHFSLDNLTLNQRLEHQSWYNANLSALCELSGLREFMSMPEILMIQTFDDLTESALLSLWNDTEGRKYKENRMSDENKLHILRCLLFLLVNTSFVDEVQTSRVVSGGLYIVGMKKTGEKLRCVEVMFAKPITEPGFAAGFKELSCSLSALMISKDKKSIYINQNDLLILIEWILRNKMPETRRESAVSMKPAWLTLKKPAVCKELAPCSTETEEEFERLSLQDKLKEYFKLKRRIADLEEEIKHGENEEQLLELGKTLTRLKRKYNRLGDELGEKFKDD
uniref:RNA-dependent RNA polymerase n=1 Tax=Beihai sipunculid worm virus 7 TaxID=1922679 RepID=A0A1L3KPC5_9VIRU|nr:RNA-dependent RNA polymerase [Beihai sipunculid worm virus 7]